jgi:hypothetical protein
MLDVHPAHHAASTWREFFIHIATIVLGLLIAIALEQAVEWVHHKQIVREARENIRKEIETNQSETAKDIRYVQDDADAMKANLAEIRRMEADPQHKESMHFEFTWSSFNESAWLSARDSGALIYMPVDEVQRYADAYEQQELVNKAAIEVFTDQTSLPATMLLVDATHPLRPDDAATLAHGCAAMFLKLHGLQELTEQLSGQYSLLLKR